MFPSKIEKLASDVPMPAHQGLRILLMPIIMGDNSTVPYPDLFPMLDVMAKVKPQHKGKVVYLTVDQKVVETGKTHRRPGLHVDGYPHTMEDQHYGDPKYFHPDGRPGIWAGHAHGGTWGGGGGWGGGSKNLYWHDGTGLLTVSSVEGCRAWNQNFPGEPKVEGDCEHLREHCKEAVVLEANSLYWMSPGCVHESMPVASDTQRTFVRLSLPSKCDWYNGCTPNPLGVKPSGKIARRRQFIDN